MQGSHAAALFDSVALRSGGYETEYEYTFMKSIHDKYGYSVRKCVVKAWQLVKRLLNRIVETILPTCTDIRIHTWDQNSEVNV